MKNNGRRVFVAASLAAAILAGCGKHSAVCSGTGADPVGQVYQYETEHDQCQQSSDCVAVGVFRDSCDCAPALHVAVTASARAGAQKLIDQAVACKQVPNLCDDYATPDVSCVNGQCRLGFYGMCLLPPEPDAQPADAGGRDAAPADAGGRDAAPADAGGRDAAPADAGGRDAAALDAAP